MTNANFFYDLAVNDVTLQVKILEGAKHPGLLILTSKGDDKPFKALTFEDNTFIKVYFYDDGITLEQPTDERNPRFNIIFYAYFTTPN